MDKGDSFEQTMLLRGLPFLFLILSLTFQGAEGPVTKKKIIRNAVRCNNCHFVIESKTTHKVSFCSCGKVGVNGGLDYLRRLGNIDDYEELSEWINM